MRIKHTQFLLHSNSYNYQPVEGRNLATTRITSGTRYEYECIASASQSMVNTLTMWLQMLASQQFKMWLNLDPMALIIVIVCKCCCWQTLIWQDALVFL